MKIRGSNSKVSLYAAVAFLACSLLLVAAFQIARNSSPRDIAVQSAAAHYPSPAPSASTDKSKWIRAYGALPLSFTENQGQLAQDVRYSSHGAQYDLFLTPQEAVVALRHSRQLDFSPRHRAASLKRLRDSRKANAATTTAALHLRFEGANPAPQVAGTEKLPGKVNYFIGNDPKKWHTGIPTYGQVKYSQVYPGVDLIFYGNPRKLEYDFVVAPGVDPSVIRMTLSGARKLSLASDGDVVVSVTDGKVLLQKPLIYQNISGQRHEIAGKYLLQGHHVSLAVANYDRREPLIVDPVLDYATYLGGTDDAGAGYAIATDSTGDAFIAGQTLATDFPATSALTPGSNTSGTGFVVELNPAGTLVYSTYLGSSAGGDFAFGIAESGGDVYVTGETFGTDFPTTTATALKPTLTVNANGTSFLTKLDPTKSTAATLLYSTYLGGTNGDFDQAVAADSSGNAYITGVTYSAADTNPPTDPTLFWVTASAYQSTLVDTAGSAFLTRIDTTQSGISSLIYSTYLGGDGAFSIAANLGFGDGGFGVVVDSSNKAYLCGATTSSSAVPFPTTATTFQATPKSGNTWSSAFISEVDTTLSGASSLAYSTYLGGSGDTAAAAGDFCTAIDLKAGSTVIYVTGYTNSPNFPIQNGFQTTGDPSFGAAFVTLLDTSVGTSLNYSTYLGNDFTTGNGIKADSTGNAYVGGSTVSLSPAQTPTSGAYQPTASTNGDGFIAEINPAGTPADLVYLTYFGGSGVSGSPDQIFGLALGASVPGVIVTGQTSSSDFPATNGTTYSGGSTTSEGFAASLTLVPTLVVSPTSLTFTATAQGTATAPQTVTLTNNTSAAIAFTSATVTGGVPAAADTDFAVTNTSCGTSIPAGMSCTLSVIFTASTTSESATLTIVDSDSSSPQTVALTGTAPALFTASPSSLSFSSTAIGAATPAQTVTLTNNTTAAVTYTSAVVTLTSAAGAAGDFALTPTCTTATPIPANGGTCTIGVIYTPSVATMETATLTITDSFGVQTVALTGTVTAVAPDFSIAASPTTLTVQKGMNGMSTITVSSIGAFSSGVTLTCAGQPHRSTCAIAPATATPTPGSPATATLTLTTTSMMAPPPSSLRYLPPASIRVVAPAFAAALLMLLMYFSERRFRTRLGLAAATLVFVALAGCGSSGTPKGNYTLTVTGTSGSLSHTTTITLTVD